MQSGSWPHGIWARWWGYLVRWLVFGLIVHLLLPVPEGVSERWLEKLQQALMGLVFGLVCALIFTLAENLLNPSRLRWRTWSLIISTWLIAKVAIVSVLALLG